MPIPGFERRVPLSPGVTRAVRLAAIALLAVMATVVAVPAHAQVLVSNIDQDTNDAITVRSWDQAQGFTTGTVAYTLGSIEVKMRNHSSSEVFDPSGLSATVVKDSATGTAVAILTGTGSIPADAGTAYHDIVFTAPSGTTLDASTTYYLVLEWNRTPDLGSPHAALTYSASEDSGGVSGWTIDNDRGLRDYNSTGPFSPRTREPLMIRVNGPLTDTTAPTVSSAAVDGTSLVITFDETLAAADSLANSAFTVKKTPSGGSEQTVSLSGSPSISGTTVTLTLATGVVSTDTAVSVSYTKPATGSSNKLEDGDGNEVASFTDQAVTNNTSTSDTTAPTVSWAAVVGTSLVITFDETLAAADSLANSAFAVKKTPSGGSEQTVSLSGSPSISGATVTLTLATAVVSTDTAVSVSYTKPTTGSNNKLEDGAGNEVASFTDQAVTNNTAATGAPGIDGTPQVGQELTATAGDIADAEDLPSTTFPDGYTFQWVRVDADGTSNPTDVGTDDETYAPVAADVGKKLKVKVGFTDGAGNPEEVESAATENAVVAAQGACPTGNDWCTTMTVGYTPEFFGIIPHQFGFSGSDPFGSLENDSIQYGGATYAVNRVAYTTFDLDVDGEVDFELDSSLPHGTVLNLDGTTFTADADSEGSTETATYYIWDSVNPDWIEGQHVTVSVKFPATNTAATGAPGIDGTPQVGQELTATAGDIADAEDLPSTMFPVGYTFQWVRVDADGTSNPTDVGTDDETYAPVAADVGKKLKVKVGFTDGAGNPEEVESAATENAVVAAQGACPTGNDWCTTMTVGYTPEFFGIIPHQFGFSGSDPFGSLENDSIQYGGATYAVNRVAYTTFDLDVDGEVDFELDSSLPHGTVLNLDGTTFTADADSESSTGKSYHWDSVNPDWIEGQHVTVSVKFPRELEFDDVNVTVDEDAGSATLLVNLSSATTGAVTVAYATSDITTTLYPATQGQDYTATLGTLTFAPGDTAETIFVPIVDDQGYGPTRRFNVTLSSPAGAQLGADSVAHVDILNDEPVPTASIADVSVSENAGAMWLTLELSHWSEMDTRYVTTSDQVGGTATVGEDYTSFITGPQRAFWVSAGQVEERRFIALVNDDVVEQDETIIIAWDLTSSNATPGTITFTGTILDDDGITAPTVSSAAVNGTSLVITFDKALAAASNLANSAFTVEKTPSGGSEQTVSLSGSPSISGATVTLTLATAVVSTDTDVKVSYTKPTTGSNNKLKDDTDNEVANFTDRAVTNNTVPSNSAAIGRPSITGTPQVGQTLTAGIGTITDTDGLPSNFPAGYTFQWVRVDGANSESDISGATSSTYMLLAADMDHTIKVKVSFTDDGGAVEGPLESHATATVRSAGLPTVRFGAASYTAIEGGAGAAVTLELSEVLQAALTVPLTLTLQGGATAADYSGVPASVTIQPGQRQVSFTVTATDDGVDDTGESLRLDIGTLRSGVASGNPSSATVALVQDEGVKIWYVYFTQPSYTATEGGAGAEVTVVLSAPWKPELNEALTVRLSAPQHQGGATSEDYSGVPESVTFAPGRTRVSFTVTATEDGVNDDGESFRLGFAAIYQGFPPELKRGRGPTIVTVHLKDNDEPGAVRVAFGARTYTAVEGGATATVAVRLSAAPGRAVTVPLTKEHNGADSGDYSGVPANVSFAANETSKTFTVTATDDSDDDDLESVTLGFGSLPESVSAGDPATTTVNLTDNDGESKMRTLRMDAHNSVIRNLREGGSYNLNFSLDEALDDPVSVPLAVEHTGGATAADYTGVPATVTFERGKRKTNVIIRAVEDAEDDDGEGFKISFGTLPAGLQVDERYSVATFKIIDNDGLPGVSVSDASGREWPNPVTYLKFEVKLSEKAEQEARVDYATRDSTATAGEDYVAESGTLVFTEGEQIKYVWVEVIDDRKAEDTETFTLRLSNAVRAVMLDDTGVGRITDRSSSGMSSDEGGGDDALLDLVRDITVEAAAAALLGADVFTSDQFDALDQLGNRNGRYDLGDMLSWRDRCKRGEADCGGTSGDAGPAGAAALLAAVRGRGTSGRTGGRAPGPRGRTPIRRARRRAGMARYATGVLFAAIAAWSCTDGSVGPAAPEPDPGLLTVELTAPAAHRDIGVLLGIEGPGIETVRASGYELYESGASEQRQIVVAGSLRSGPVVQFRVPDRNQLAQYRVRVLQVTGEDYGLRDVGEYGAVIRSR